MVEVRRLLALAAYMSSFLPHEAGADCNLECSMALFSLLLRDYFSVLLFFSPSPSSSSSLSLFKEEDPPPPYRHPLTPYTDPAVAAAVVAAAVAAASGDASLASVAVVAAAAISPVVGRRSGRLLFPPHCRLPFNDFIGCLVGLIFPHSLLGCCWLRRWLQVF